MKLRWVNFGSISWLVDEYGQRRGMIKPVGKQVQGRNLNEFYAASRAFTDDEYKMLGRPPNTRNKGA